MAVVAGRDGPDCGALLESASGLCLVLDLDFRVVAVSDMFAAATMTDPDTMVGRDVFDVWREGADSGGVAELHASLERARDERVVDTPPVRRQDIRLPADQGGGVEERYWTQRNVPVADRNGCVRYVIHQVEDVTRLVRRSDELRAANSELQAASSAKNAFQAHMAHELRTPLAAISGFSELLGDARLDADSREMLGSIRSACRHMAGLLDDVLDLSLVEAGRVSVSPEPAHVAPLVRDIVELMRPLAASHRVGLMPAAVAEPNVRVFADCQRLRQVLINLISNAIKFNRPGGSVVVVAAAARSPGPDRVRITVTDTGPGIPAEAQQRLFTPFERLDTSEGIEGHGLGLALSKSLVEAMHGSITLRSSVGHGTTVGVELPRAPDDVANGAGDREWQPATHTYPGSRRVLCVDDAITNLRLIRELLLRRPSIDVMPTARGATAPQLARTHHPDLILLDLHLPDVGGEQILHQLRIHPATHDIPVVILSADQSDQSRARLLAAGAHDYLTKPVRPRRLLSVLDELLEQPHGPPRTAG